MWEAVLLEEAAAGYESMWGRFLAAARSARMVFREAELLEAAEAAGG
jgi:hypothetical protein